MDAKIGFVGIRSKVPRTIALIACFGTAFATSACGGSSGTPATPVLLGVLDGSCAELPPGTSGGFRVLSASAGEARLRVAAAWPSADLAVKANTVDLKKVGPGDTGQQSALETAGEGWWAAEDINPNPTPPVWTLRVKLPASMRGAPTITLELVSSTPGGASSPRLTVDLKQDMGADAPAWNRVHLDWRDRGDEAGYLLERSEKGGPYTPLVSLGRDASSYTDTQVRGNRQYSYRLTAQSCGPSNPPGGPGSGFSRSTVAITTPKESGVVGVTLTHSGPSSREYETSFSSSIPEDAVISEVINLAKDKNDLGLSLGAVRHTDANGVIRSENPSGPLCPDAITLHPGNTTHRFDGLTVDGEWKAKVVCLLPNDDPKWYIVLNVAWTQ